MKLFIVLFALIAVAVAQNKYTTKYDGVDLDEILKSDRLFNSYYKCLIDTGRCTPDGSELKRNLPEALRTNCEKCSDRQRDGTDRVLRFISKNKPDQWKTLRAKYDPDNVLVAKYSEEAKKRGIEI